MLLIIPLNLQQNLKVTNSVEPVCPPRWSHVSKLLDRINTMLKDVPSVAKALYGYRHSPDTSDLQLGLGARLLGFDCLIRDDGGGCAA